jgi:hypothetical protein
MTLIGKNKKNEDKQKGNTPENAAQQTAQQAVQQRLPIKDIKNDVLYTKDGCIVAYLYVNDVNISLMNKKELMRIVSGISATWNGLNESFQIFSIGRPVDINDFIHALDDEIQAATPENKKLLIMDKKEILNQVTTGQLAERQHYLIFRRKYEDTQSVVKLLEYCEEMIRGFASVNIKLQLCDNAEILKLNDLYFNTELSTYDNDVVIYGDVTFLNE